MPNHSKRRRSDGEDGTDTPTHTTSCDTSWDGLVTIPRSDFEGLVRWLIERCGDDLPRYIKSLVRFFGDPQAIAAIDNDTIYRAAKYIRKELDKNPQKLMAQPVQALLFSLATRACVDWLRKEIRWRDHHQSIGDLPSEIAAQPNGHALRGSVKRHNGREMVQQVESLPFDPIADPTWEEFQSDLEHLYEVLDLNENERDTYTASTMLQREYEEKHEKLPKKGFLCLVAEKFQINTARPVTTEEIKEWRSSARKKIKNYQTRQRRLLPGELGDGGHDGHGQEAKRKRAGAPTSAEGPDRRGPPKGGGRRE